MISPLTPRIAREAGNVNWHVSKGDTDTNASGVDGLGRAEYDLADMIASLQVDFTIFAYGGLLAAQNDLNNQLKSIKI